MTCVFAGMPLFKTNKKILQALDLIMKNPSVYSSEPKPLLSCHSNLMVSPSLMWSTLGHVEFPFTRH